MMGYAMRLKRGGIELSSRTQFHCWGSTIRNTRNKIGAHTLESVWRRPQPDTWSTGSVRFRAARRDRLKDCLRLEHKLRLGISRTHFIGVEIRPLGTLPRDGPPESSARAAHEQPLGPWGRARFDSDHSEPGHFPWKTMPCIRHSSFHMQLYARI
jgi:hypothetical protein